MIEVIFYHFYPLNFSQLKAYTTSLLQSISIQYIFTKIYLFSWYEKAQCNASNNTYMTVRVRIEKKNMSLYFYLTFKNPN